LADFIMLLLPHESDPIRTDELLRESCFRNQAAAMQLALKHRASVDSVSFQDVIKTWNSL